MISHGTRFAQKSGRVQERFACEKNIGALPENGAKMGCLTHSILVKRQNQRDFHGVVRG
jgi:hypothetical protein